jgi:hypothetical protein
MKTIHFMHVVVLSSVPWLVTAAAAQEFSADQVIHDPTGRIIKSKIYMGQGKVRAEDRDDTAGTNPKFNSIFIADLARRVAYELTPARKTYMELSTARFPQSFDGFHISGDLCALNPQANVKKVEDFKCTSAKLGSEVVSGRTTDKWEVTVRFGGQIYKSDIWIDTHLHVVLKTDSQGAGSELQNLQEGPQPAALFEIPTDYHKIDMEDMLRGIPPR